MTGARAFAYVTNDYYSREKGEPDEKEKGWETKKNYEPTHIQSKYERIEFVG